MERVVLGNLISSGVAFAGVAIIFLLGSWVFNKLGIGPVFLDHKQKPDDKE